MSVLSITLIILTAVAVVVWVIVRNALWGAAFVVAGLFLLASFGLLWWWVPYIGAALLLIGALIALLIARRAGRAVLTGVAILGIVLAAGFVGIPQLVQSSASADGGSANLSADARKLITDSLTVTTTSADAECKTDDYKLVTYNVGALQSVPSPRLWSDSISTPFSATEAEAIRNELQQAICSDPLLGVSYLTFFATDIRDALKASTGVDIVDLNPWLKPYEADPSNINKTAAEFVPLLDVEDPSSSQLDSAMTKNHEWQHEASYVNTLLDRFALSGIDTPMSVVNYHLAVGGLVVGALPAVERSPNQENLAALVFSLTEKDQCDNLLTMGSNLADKRPELFQAKTCEAAPPATTPAVTPENPSTPSSPGCTSDCGGTPTCTSDCGGGTPSCEETNSCNTPTCEETGDCKDWNDSVDPPDGVSVQPNDPYEPPSAVTAPSDPAPVLPGGDNPSGSDTPAQGADPSTGNSPAPDPGTGTTPSGGSGSVNPPSDPGSTTPPENSGDPGSPF